MDITTTTVGTFTNCGIFLGFEGSRVKFQALQGWLTFVPTPERMATIHAITEKEWNEKRAAYEARVAAYLDTLPAGAPV